jgi:hypothetical protein
MQSATQQQPSTVAQERRRRRGRQHQGKTLKHKQNPKNTHTQTQHRRASAYFSVEGEEFYLVVSQVPCPFLSSFLPSHALPKVSRMFLCWLSPSVRRERLQKKNIVFFSFGPRFWGMFTRRFCELVFEFILRTFHSVFLWTFGSSLRGMFARCLCELLF